MEKKIRKLVEERILKENLPLHPKKKGGKLSLHGGKLLKSGKSIRGRGSGVRGGFLGFLASLALPVVSKLIGGKASKKEKYAKKKLSKIQLDPNALTPQELKQIYKYKKLKKNKVVKRGGFLPFLLGMAAPLIGKLFGGKVASKVKKVRKDNEQFKFISGKMDKYNPKDIKKFKRISKWYLSLRDGGMLKKPGKFRIFLESIKKDKSKKKGGNSLLEDAYEEYAKQHEPAKRTTIPVDPTKRIKFSGPELILNLAGEELARDLAGRPMKREKKKEELDELERMILYTEGGKPRPLYERLPDTVLDYLALGPMNPANVGDNPQIRMNQGRNPKLMLYEGNRGRGKEPTPAHLISMLGINTQTDLLVQHAETIARPKGQFLSKDQHKKLMKKILGRGGADPDSRKYNKYMKMLKAALDLPSLARVREHLRSKYSIKRITLKTLIRELLALGIAVENELAPSKAKKFYEEDIEVPVIDKEEWEL